MAITFSRSTAALRADSHRRSLLGIAVAAVLLGGWTLWFFGSTVGLYESTPVGRLEASQATHPLQAPVAGRVVQTRLVLDRAVKQGEVLVELDARSQKLELSEARARQTALSQQRGALRKEVAAEEQALQVSRQAGQVALKEARARHKESEVVARYSEEKARRLTRLRKGGQMSEMEYLRAQAEAQKSKASADTMRIATTREAREQRILERDRLANLEKLRSALVKVAGELATVEASIKRLEHNIEQRRIRAPIDGRLGEITRLAAGAYVKQGQQLASIVPAGRLRSVAQFKPEAALGRIRPGQPARIRLPGFPWTQYGSVRATVARVASEASDGTVRAELDLHPDPASPIPLQHGLPAEVEVEVDRVSPAVLVLRAAGKLLGELRASADAKNTPAAGDK